MYFIKYVVVLLVILLIHYRYVNNDRKHLYWNKEQPVVFEYNNKEGLIINNPQRKLPKEQRKLFEDNGWEIIDSAQPAHNEPPPLCYSSTWLSMNVLVLDPKTVCVEKSEVYQAEQLDKLGMEVVPVELRDAYAFGGGLHCCTADVYREGDLKDYFPKQ